jgi:ubiquinone/menaquinone biosynthesis C-methylase UbiE
MSISFDRIAARYDATRGFPPGVDTQFATAFRRLSGLSLDARLLEIGVGTGRIAIPLASLGYPYIGLDLSKNMMAQLRERLPPRVDIMLMRGDATALPLRDASVDGAIVVHVFHLIAGWEQAAAELRRVVRPGGIIATGFNKTNAPLPSDKMREQWSTIIGELGGNSKRPGARITQEEPLLASLFGPPRRAILATWVRRQSLREQLDLLAARTTSATWQLPDALLHESLRRAESWARETYGDLDRQHSTDVHFTMIFYGATDGSS